jgi:hypothetical protein
VPGVAASVCEATLATSLQTAVAIPCAWLYLRDVGKDAPKPQARVSKPPSKVIGRQRIGYTALFVVVTIFWGTAAAVPGSIPQRVLAGVLCLSFAYSAWRAGRRGEVDDDDPADNRLSDWLN